MTMHPKMLAALGEPNRLRIVELLRARPRPVTDIHSRLKLRQAASVSMGAAVTTGRVIRHSLHDRKPKRCERVTVKR
jgi:DNA-binding transcriptional ArsR family regulator